MSQFFVQNSSSGPFPPQVPTQFTADDGTVGIPVANNYNILSRDTDENNLNGIATTVDPNGSDNHYIQLTNRATGTVETVGAVTDNVITFVAPNTAGIYQISVYISAWDNADLLGATYEVYGSIKCDGAGGLATVGTPLRDADVDTGFSATQVTVSFTGLTITVPVTGLAGKTIKWTGLLTYVFGGA